MTTNTEYDDFILLKWHRHNGKLYQPGKILKLPVQLGTWLVSQNIARRSRLIVTPSLSAPTPVLLKPAVKRRSVRRCCGW